MMNINTQEIFDLLFTYGLKIITGLIILFIGIKVAGFTDRKIESLLHKKADIDEMLVKFLSNIVRYSIIAFSVAAFLNQVGIQTASIIAVLGTAGLAIGLAMQGTLSNIAAGVMLLIFRPFKTGHYVEVGGHGGTVKSLNLFTTELATPDNVQIIIPNNSVWGSSVVNYSFHDTRRVDFILSISYSDNINTGIDTIKSVIDRDARIQKTPEPQIVVSELAASSVDITVRVWVEKDNYWPVKFDFTRQFKDNLEAAGLNIPFPQQDVHLIR